jgi:hypothetical protein
MPVTVKVNGTVNSLVHKGSNHISAATIPDVCKTPSPAGPVPIPYPNISQSATLDKGTTTVKADGGMMIATKGSEFSLSNGDNAGVAGGVKSSTFMKESTWILYSFDVKMDGNNACRLSDKKFQNHENTADLMGAVGDSLTVAEAVAELKKIACDCQEQTKPKTVPKTAAARRKACQKLIDERGKCVTKKLKEREKHGMWANARFKDPTGAKSRLQPDVVITAPGSFPSTTTSVGKRARALKVGLSAGDVKKVVDFKFPCPPALTEPYPAAGPSTLGFGPVTPPGPKELNEYRDISNPPDDVEVFTPNATDCP